MDANEIGRRLAERQVVTDPSAADPPAAVDETRSLLNYAEVPHVGDWTLRSALVRLAQPEPARVGALLQVMRRLDAPLHHVTRALQANPAVCDLALVDQTIDRAGLVATPAVDTVVDARIVDVARATVDGLDGEALLVGYASVTPLDREEQLAAPLLVVAAGFDRLARRLATWADGGATEPGNPAPVDEVERVTRTALARLDELGVPTEGPPPRGARGRG